MTTFAPTAIRASEIARCTRMAALRGLGAEQVEYDEQTRRYFARGHLYSRYVCDQLAAKFGKENVLREVEIPHPLGVGHADAYVTTEKLLVEIKSTVTPTTSSPMFDMAVDQLRFYLHFHPEAETGALYLVNPSDLSREDAFTVKLTDEDREKIDTQILEIVGAVEGHDLPGRVCTKPSQARGRLCPFAVACFDGWQEPETLEVDDPVALELASRLVALKAEERTYKALLETAEEARKEVQAEMSEYVPYGETTVGPFTVKRWHVNGRTTFQHKAAEAAGISRELLAPFTKIGEGYDRLEVSLADEAGDVDYGSVPWEDEAA